jgi:putative aminopeptidase FrvX
MASHNAPRFLLDLLHSRSPSGYETEAQAIFDAYVKGVAESYSSDALGNRLATLNSLGDPVLMLAGSLDEIGLIITFITKTGFIFFEAIGAQDVGVIPGRRVIIQTASGPILGITGKRAIHLLDESERKKVPEAHDIWIDIGARNRREALDRVEIGDVATYDEEFQIVNGSIGAARGFDNKMGAYIVGETFIRLSKTPEKLAAKIVAVATTQEKIGQRGATTAAHAVNPHVAVVLNAGHVVDHPDGNYRKHGEAKVGGGPILGRGPNINPVVFDRLVNAAKKLAIPYQIAAYARPHSSEARPIQITRAGVATGLISIPLRYKHTSSEVVDLQDIEHCIRLLVEFAAGLKKGDHGHW